MITQFEGVKLDATVYNPGPQTYEAELVPRIFKPWAHRLTEAARLMAGERVLDIACGTGIVARNAAGRVGPGGTVVGVDVNPAMLEMARTMAVALRTPIEFIEGNAQALPLPDSSFDVAFCQQGLQFFTDRAAALRELHRVLTPRGRAIYAVWRGIDHHVALMDLDSKVLRRHLPAEVLQGADAPFTLGDLDEIRALFNAAGFGEIHIRGHVSEIRFPSARRMLDALSGAHAPLAAAVAQLSEDARETMFADVEQEVRPYADDDGVMYTMTGALITVRK